MTASRTRYAQVGLGGRSRMYTRAIAGTYHDTAEIVGLCDLNQARMDLTNRTVLAEVGAVKTYLAADFDRMIAETKPDVVIVTTMDTTHADYICRAMELGCNVITEKPMTTDEEKCRRIIGTSVRTRKTCQVTFNYRYAPPRSQLREIIASGAVGEIYSGDFCWMLDTRHGADYFRRWHRNRRNSGSLLVHKATHHFDLINWFIHDVPEEVFAFGSRRYYRPETAERMGLQGRGERCHECSVSDKCPFFLDMASIESMKAMYLDCEQDDPHYVRDRCVFSPDIDIWDNMTLSVRYRSGALLSYILTACSPYEGYRVVFNGSKRRLEHGACEDTYISGDGSVPGELQRKKTFITLIPEFSPPQEIEVRVAKGGHGGGDSPLLADIFEPDAPADPLARKAGITDGAYSILIGVAACHSIDSGKPVKISDLLAGAPLDKVPAV